MIKIYESKQDEQNLINYVGNDIANQFLNIRKKFKSPYNDIYYWLKKEPSELKDYINNYQSRTAKDRADKSNGAKLIYSDSEWKVYYITTYEASRLYGKGTKWCITADKTGNDKESGIDTRGEGGEYWWNYYKDEGIKMYFYFRSNGEKYAVAYNPKYDDCEIYNAVDKQVNFIEDAPRIKGLKVSVTDEDFKSLDTDTKIYILSDYFNVNENDIDMVNENKFNVKGYGTYDVESKYGKIVPICAKLLKEEINKNGFKSFTNDDVRNMISINGLDDDNFVHDYYYDEFGKEFDYLYKNDQEELLYHLTYDMSLISEEDAENGTYEDLYDYKTEYVEDMFGLVLSCSEDDNEYLIEHFIDEFGKNGVYKMLKENGIRFNYIEMASILISKVSTTYIFDICGIESHTAEYDHDRLCIFAV